MQSEDESSNSGNLCTSLAFRTSLNSTTLLVLFVVVGALERLWGICQRFHTCGFDSHSCVLLGQKNVHYAGWKRKEKENCMKEKAEKKSVISRHTIINALTPLRLLFLLLFVH